MVAKLKPAIAATLFKRALLVEYTCVILSDSEQSDGPNVSLEYIKADSPSKARELVRELWPTSWLDWKKEEWDESEDSAPFPYTVDDVPYGDIVLTFEGSPKEV